MVSHIDPERGQMEAFKALPQGTPIQMLNLVRLRETAIYRDGRASSGWEAYQAYGRLSQPVLRRVGGEIVWRGSMEQMLIGPTEELWDHCFIAAYPDAGAFLAMLIDPEYQKALRHLQAAVADSRLIRLRASAEGGGFGG